MMTYQEKTLVEERLMEYCLARTGSDSTKYAAAFGSVWALLNDEQLKTLDRFLDEWTK